MKEDEEQREGRRRLKSLATAGGFTARRNGTGYELSFHGKYRDFDVRTSLNEGWLRMAVYILQLPPAGGTRSRLLERMAELNAQMPLVKFTKSDDVLSLDLQYRDEHLDVAVFGNLIGLLRDLAEQHYPEIFRIVTGQEALESLEAAFQRSRAAVE